MVFTASKPGIIVNDSPVGAIKLSGSDYTLVGSGKTFTENGQVDLSDYKLRVQPEFLKADKFYIADGLVAGGKTDNSQKLNQFLSTVETNSVVLISNGIYRINSPVTVPKNVEIRSSQGSFSRTNQSQNGKNGVVFVSYADDATIKLSEGSGIRGIRLRHAKNDYKSAYNALIANNPKNDSSVKAMGNGACAYMNESVGAYVAYDFIASNNHIIKSNYGIAYKNLIRAGGSDGLIVSCLANPNFMTRANLYDYFDSSSSNVQNWIDMRNSGENSEVFFVLRDDISRVYTTMVELTYADGEKVLYAFCYGEAGLFNIKRSENAVKYSLFDCDSKPNGSNAVFNTDGKYINSGTGGRKLSGNANVAVNFTQKDLKAFEN